MKAVWYTKFGPAGDVLEFGDYSTPEPAEGEVKVRLYTTGVNPSDTKKRLGANPALLDGGPVIPNSDGAGEIVALGATVDDRKVGERVWIYNAQYGRQEGTSAEYVCVPSNQAVRMPDNASYETGAMMGIPAMTAHRCVCADGNVDGQILLITGGSGRVGYYAIQWAKYFGPTVIALGPPVLRGSVVEAKLIGVLKLSDREERDDKLIAVLANSPLYKADSIKELDEKFPGISQILEIWFIGYIRRTICSQRVFGGLKKR